MSSKKGKKSKGKTMPLQDFLGDSPVSMPVTTKITNWADDHESDYPYPSRAKDPVVLPTAPRAARDSSFNEENIPQEPPFMAYMSNVPYEAEEEDLIEFFAEMKVVGIRLPKDSMKSKGYGYVEFADRQSLISALDMSDKNLKGRRLRIEVSTNNDERKGGRMNRMGRDYSSDRTTGNWRSARANDGPQDDDRNNDRGGYRSRGYERRDDQEGGSETAKNWRDGPRETIPDRPRPSFRDARDSRPGPDDDRDRGMGSRFSDRSGPRGMRDSRDGSRERDGERGNYGSRRHFNEDVDREKDRWSNVRNQPREREPRNNEPPPEPPAPMTRPKLELKPRTKPIESAASAKDENASDGSEAKPATNIFGAARPVDTATREREIEERLAKLHTETKEQRPPAREGGTWGRRNGEDRNDDRQSRSTWRSRPDGNDQRDNRDSRDSRDRRDNRDNRDLRDRRDNRDIRDSRDRRDNRDSRDSRDRRDNRDNRDNREYIRDSQNSRDSSKPRDTRNDSRGSSSSRGPLPRGPSSKQVDNRSPPDGAEREKRKAELTEEEELSRMPKVKEDPIPNFVASNKYSMLKDDIDADIIET